MSFGFQNGTVLVYVKDWITSKTMWANSIAFIMALITLLSGPEFLALMPKEYHDGILKFLAFATAVVNLILRPFTTSPLKGMAPATKIVVLMVFACFPPASYAEPVVIDTTGAKPGKYFYEVQVDSTGKATVAQVKKVVGVDGNPTSPGNPTNPNPTDPNPPPPVSLFTQKVQQITQAAINRGGTKTTGAALSTVYSLVGDAVEAGTIPPGNALPAVKQATDLILASQADREHWVEWRASMSEALNILAQDGSLQTKEQYVQTLKAIALGLKNTTGFIQTNIAKLSTNDPKDWEDWYWQDGILKQGKPQAGILDGIDMAKIIELIKLVMELLKLFGIGGIGGGGGV